MYSLITVAAVLIALGSWLFVTQATAGVAGLCFACFLGILARLVQAERHHRALPEQVAVKRARAEKIQALQADYMKSVPSNAAIEEKARAAGISNG
jgi:heme exporter protein D